MDDEPPRWRRGGRRTPLILQTEAAECGLACLAMVASSLGLDTDLPAMRRRFSVSTQGVTLADLVRMAGALQLQARPLRAELDELPQLQTPCILHWDMNHFVVLVSLRRGVATLHDPGQGLRRLTLAELSPHFTGVALELRRGAGFVPRREREPARLGDLLGPVDGLRRSLAQVVVLALALELFTLLAPFFMQWVVDGVLPGPDRDLLATLGIGFTLLVGLQVAAAAARGWAVLVLATSLNLQWLLNVFAHLLRLPMDWFEKRHAGDIWSRFGAVHQIQKTLTTHFAEALLDGVMVLATLAVMLLYSPRLAAIALAAVAAYALLRALLMRPLREATEETLVFESRQASHFLESLRGMQAIKLFNAQAERHARHAALAVDAQNAEVATRRLELVSATGHRLLFGLERVAVVWLGATLVLDGQLTVGMLFAFFAFKEQFALRVSALVDKAVALRMLRVQADRLADIVLAAPEDDGGPPPPREAGAPPPVVELAGVHFRYADGEPEVLAGVDLRIEPGESVALVGPSGCGKSTLLKILLGIHTPTAGEVRVGGVPLARLGLARWRAQVGAVMQDEPLFTGSVADNIGFFDPRPDRARVEACARLAAVHDEIAALPMGYETLIGEFGSSLSGGQRQRLLLARALYREPAVLLLDEATSALDVEREAEVNRAVGSLALTRIVVAHRPQTIAAARRVVTLGGGRVVGDEQPGAPPG